MIRFHLLIVRTSREPISSRSVGVNSTSCVNKNERELAPWKARLSTRSYVNEMNKFVLLGRRDFILIGADVPFGECVLRIFCVNKLFSFMNRRNDLFPDSEVSYY